DEFTPISGERIQEKQPIIVNESIHYLREISSIVRQYHTNVDKQSELARHVYQLTGTKEVMQDEAIQHAIDERITEYEEEMSQKAKRLLHSFASLQEMYNQEEFTFKVREKEIKMAITTTSLSGLRIPKVK